MNNRIFLLGILLVIFIVSSLPAFSQTEINITSTSKLGGSDEITIRGAKKRWYNPADPQDSKKKVDIPNDKEIDLSYEKYLLGVLHAEVSFYGNHLPDDEAKTAYKAMGVTANTFYRWEANEVHGGSFDIHGDTRDQAVIIVDTDTQPEIEDVVENGGIVTVNSVEVMQPPWSNDYAVSRGQKYFLADYYSHDHDRYTVNREKSPGSPGRYSTVERSTLTPESKTLAHEQVVPTVNIQGNQVGLSQVGAFKLSANKSANNWDYHSILKHYYGPAPPYLRTIQLQEQDSANYTARWQNDFNYSPQKTLAQQSPTRKLTNPSGGDTIIKNPFTLQLNFSEIVDLSQGTHRPQKVRDVSVV